MGPIENPLILLDLNILYSLLLFLFLFIGFHFFYFDCSSKVRCPVRFGKFCLLFCNFLELYVFCRCLDSRIRLDCHDPMMIVITTIVGPP